MRGKKAKELRRAARSIAANPGDVTYRMKVLKKFIDKNGKEVATRGMILCAPARRLYLEMKKEHA